MTNKVADIVIIGAGLTGLCLAYYLKDTQLTIKILEARDRIGGRILTNTSKDAAIEMGATWFGKQHGELFKLLQELKLDVFEQEIGEKAIYEPTVNSPHQVVDLPQNQEVSFRVRGGSFKIIDALLDALNPDQIVLNQAVNSILKEDDCLVCSTEIDRYTSKWVISTLPPYLLINSIAISPGLPTSLIEAASNTHTWMGESIKVGLSYKQPFWKEDGKTGTIFSNSGPVTEMYDHTDFEQATFALKGFLNASFYSITKAERISAILNQLEKYYGPQVRDYIDYHELLWMHEPFTYQRYPNQLFPHQNNGHMAYRSSYLDNKLILAGTEAALMFPGYMEGAVRSAQEVFQRIIEANNR